MAAQPNEERKIRYYMMQNFYLQNGTQVERIHAYMKDALLPALEREGTRAVLVLEALVAPHMPQVVTLSGLRSLEEIASLRDRMRANKELTKSFAEWEQGEEAPYEHYTTTLLEASRYSPQMEIPATPPKSPRIFELRVYHSPTHRQLEALHERFAGPEIQIFHRVGVHPILYTSTLAGPHMPNLTYVIPFDSLDAREKAWAKFGADPEWVKVRRESIERSGQISSVIQISLFRATAYSPVR